MNIVLKIRPEPYRRMRTGKGMVYTDPEYRAYKEAIWRMTASQYRDQPIDGAISLMLTFAFKNPATHANKPVPRPYNRRPDIDNLAKPIMDALNGVLWNDDSQITKVFAEKIYSDYDYISISAEKQQ